MHPKTQAVSDALDDTDLAILTRLATDGRATLQEVADGVRLRRPSVHARVKRLEADGVIRGYRADVDPDVLGGSLVAFAFLHISHGRGTDCLKACGGVAEALRKIPQVLEFHTLAGEDDAVVKLRVADVRELERIVMRDITAIPGVERVRTSIAMSTHFERPLSVRPPKRRRP